MPQRAPRNRTLTCTAAEVRRLCRDILRLSSPVSSTEVAGRVIGGDTFQIAGYLPQGLADLLILDLPYNRTKNYHGLAFRQQAGLRYQHWFAAAVEVLLPLLKPNATIYVCADWQTSALVLPVLEAHFYIRNRITWEREKGRGARTNWKNNAEDIWFCTAGSNYHFDVESVKLKRQVVAPYKAGGRPKDWIPEAGGNYRLTHPSNVWTDISVPFWSMPENTDHPTQKPEKLIAKLMLASTKPGDFVLDPFLGSGTSAVVAKKLQRRWSGVEINTQYACWALKRIAAADRDTTIQGYAGGVFWERNTRANRSDRAPSARTNR